MSKIIHLKNELMACIGNNAGNIKIYIWNTTSQALLNSFTPSPT